MRWSPASALPCKRSSASPCASSWLASSIWISVTRPPHCRANAAHDPTRPPPPMIVTFTDDPGGKAARRQGGEPAGLQARTAARLRGDDAAGQLAGSQACELAASLELLHDPVR